MNKINTFVIPHLNNPGLRTTLESIRRNTPPNFNIILLDFNPEGYQQVDDLVDIHIRTKNLGFAKAMNTGIRLADTKYVSCWNDDAEGINKKWWDGIEETFKRYGTALGVNPSSPRNPRCSGCEPINHPGIEYKPDFNDEEYDNLIKEVSKGHIIDGICTFATVFDMDKMDKVFGCIPGKCWFDEKFFPGGGEDYDLNRRAYMTKIPDNDMKGYRMLGTGLSFVWHWWYMSKSPQSGVAGVKYSSTFNEKWGSGADIYGRVGKEEIPLNEIRSLDQCEL
jgi:glycosyltransferase involved in cell wall biosynthesis